MSDRLSWWKCQHCHGTGRVFVPWYSKTSEPCFKCDATGNAFVDGEKMRHERRVLEERIAMWGEKFSAAR